MVRLFSNFLADMDLRPSSKHSIERKDNNGDYCPENCYWATKIEQANNQRSNRLLTYGGKTQNIIKWSVEKNISTRTICSRLNLGWSDEETLSRPIDKKESIVLTFNNKTLTIPQWAKEVGLSRQTILHRYNKGLCIEEILNPDLKRKRAK